MSRLKYSFKTVNEIWNSEKMEKLRKLHNSGLGNDTMICKNCPANIVPITDGEKMEKKTLNYVDYECAEKAHC